MKRDMDLIRALLLAVEDSPSGRMWSAEISGYTHEQLFYHVELADEAGLVEASLLEPDGFVVKRLTYTGHEFLDAARSDTNWNKAKETVLKNAGTLTLEALKVALSVLMKRAGMS